jgi:hypothetical protein
MQDAQRAGDVAKAQEIRDKLQSLRTRASSFANEFLDEVSTFLNEEQLSTLETIREDTSRRPGRSRNQQDPLAFVDTLPEALSLTDDQRAKFNTYRAELKKTLDGGKEESKAMRGLLRELREAKEAGDKAREAQIKEKLAREHAKADPLDDFYQKLDKTLTREQRSELETLRRNRPLSQDLSDYRTLLRLVNRLNLSDEQKDEVERIRQDAIGQARQIGSDPAKRAEFAKEVKEDLMNILTEDQKVEFENLLSRPSPQQRRLGGDSERPRRERRQPAEPEGDAGEHDGGAADEP